MKKAFLFPARHDEKIAAAFSQATDHAASVYEKHVAKEEWHRLVMRRKFEKICILLKAVGRYGYFVVVAIVVVFFRPKGDALSEGRLGEFLPPLLICAAGGALVALLGASAEILREVVAKRFPSGDDS